MFALVLSWMLSLAPLGPRTEEIAHAIDSASEGSAHMAAVLVSVAWYESRFKVDAVGDHGASVGLYQVGRSNLKIPADIVLADPLLATLEAKRMILESWRVCKREPLEYRLGWYAAGGEGCRGKAASQRRMKLARTLLERGDHELHTD